MQKRVSLARTAATESSVLLRNQNGRFQDVSQRGGPYFERDHLGRGLALGDLDNDGRLDAVETR